jgi:hypothetical protein
VIEVRIEDVGEEKRRIAIAGQLPISNVRRPES